jgi:hypothetical protein
MNNTRTRAGDQEHVVIRRCDTHHEYFAIAAAILNLAYRPESAPASDFSLAAKRVWGFLDLRTRRN